jgi:hypothetical protein
MPILRQMFSVSSNRLDVLSWMQQGRIVLLNLAPQGRVPDQIADALGGLVLNEVLSVARSVPLGTRYSTYLILDEFQRFVGPDIEAAIPEVRQLGVKLLLSHQSFSQLKRGEYDLTSLIWQPQTRMMFGVQGEDADLLAHECAALQYDPRRVKDEIWHRKQLVTGHRIIELASRGNTESLAKQWNETVGGSLTRREPALGSPQIEDRTRSDQESKTRGGSEVQASTQGTHEALLPEYEKYLELSSRTYSPFDEQKYEWAREVRRLQTGQALLRMVNDETLYPLDVRMSAPGSVGIDWSYILQKMPRIADQVSILIAQNFAQPCFVSPSLVERETRERLERVLQAPIVITARDVQAEAPDESEEENNLLD